MNIIRHRSVQASAATAVLLGVLHAGVTPLPWWMWATWAAVTVASVGQAIAQTRNHA